MSSSARARERWAAVFVNALGLFLLTAVIAIGAQRLFGDSDPALHVATGRFIAAHGEVPRIDPFSATYAGRPWFAHEWLADLIWYGVYHAAGWPGLLAWSAALIAAAHVLLYRGMTGRGNDPLIAFMTVALTASAAAIHWLARPHLLTLLFVVVWALILEDVGRGEASVRRLTWLPLSMVLWVNFHGGFLVAFIVLGCYVLGGAVNSILGAGRQPAPPSGLTRTGWMAAAGAAAAAATLVNPYGAALHAHLLRYFASPRPGLARNMEFAPASLSDRAGVSLLVLVAAGVISLGAHLLAIRRRSAVVPPSAGAVLAFAVTSIMAAISVRHVAVAAVFAALVIGDGLSAALSEGPARAARRPRGALFVAGCLVAMGLALAGLPRRAGYDPDTFPVKLVDSLRASGEAPSGAVFAPDLWGGYLILEWPGAKVFVDGRSDMYGDDFILRYANAYEAGPGWRGTLDGAVVSLAILPRGAPLASALASEPGWSAIAEDRAAIAYRRQPHQ